MNFDPKQRLGDLSVSQMQSVEIAKAVSADCQGADSGRTDLFFDGKRS